MKKTVKTVCIIAVLALAFSLSGCCVSHKYTDATCTSPMVCTVCGKTKGEPLGHSWAEATCEYPQTCTRCGATEGQKLGHDWVDADCEHPVTCSRCGETKGKALGHNALNGICTRCGTLIPMDMPQNGEILIPTNLTRDSSLTIISSASENYFIKLKDRAGNDVFGFFVRAGRNVTIDVPSNSYYLYFAAGDEWYGTKYCFGENTSYAKDSTICDFYNYEYTYTLYPVANGNFSETPVSEDEF